MFSAQLQARPIGHRFHGDKRAPRYAYFFPLPERCYTMGMLFLTGKGFFRLVRVGKLSFDWAELLFDWKQLRLDWAQSQKGPQGRECLFFIGTCSGVHWGALGCFGALWAASGCFGLHWAAVGCCGLLWLQGSWRKPEPFINRSHSRRLWI